MSERKLSVPLCPSTNCPKPPTNRSPSSLPSYVLSDKSISMPRCIPLGMLYDSIPSKIQLNSSSCQIRLVKRVSIKATFSTAQHFYYIKDEQQIQNSSFCESNYIDRYVNQIPTIRHLPLKHVMSGYRDCLTVCSLSSQYCLAQTK